MNFDSDYHKLQDTINSNDLNALKELIESGIDINSICPNTKMNIIQFCISKLDIISLNFNDFFEFMVKNGINLNHQDKDGLSSLHYAIDEKPEIVELLLKQGVTVDLKNKNGNTPLFDAVMGYRGEENKLKIINVLLNSGANPDIKNNYGNSPRTIVIRRHESMKVTKKPKEWDLEPHLKWIVDSD